MITKEKEEKGIIKENNNTEYWFNLKTKQAF